MKCLEKDRTRRYDTATALAADIERFLKNDPILARPPSTAYRLQKLIRRNKLGFAAAAAIGLLLLLGGVLTGWQAVRATRAEKRLGEQAARADAEARRARQAELAARQESATAQAERARAERQAEAIRLLSYVDAMNVAQRYYSEGNYAQPLSLLQTPQFRQGKTDLRGFEWRYLYRLCRGNFSRALPTHPQVLGRMEVSPDGRLMASMVADGRAIVWDASRWSKVCEIPKTDGTSLLFSLDSRRLISSNGKSWNSITGSAEQKCRR